MYVAGTVCGVIAGLVLKSFLGIRKPAATALPQFDNLPMQASGLLRMVGWNRTRRS